MTACIDWRQDRGLLLLNQVLARFGHAAGFALTSLPYSHAPGWAAVNFRLPHEGRPREFTLVGGSDGRLRLLRDGREVPLPAA